MLVKKTGMKKNGKAASHFNKQTSRHFIQINGTARALSA
jgi:hypothetical protein